MRVFIDSNILFSIAYNGREASRSYIVYELQDKGILSVYISRLVRDEARFNIKNKRPDSMYLLEDIINKSILLDDCLSHIQNKGVMSLPINDRIILCTAVTNDMDFFITGNSRDFGHLYGLTVNKTTILRPKEFLLNPDIYNK